MVTLAPSGFTPIISIPPATSNGSGTSPLTGHNLLSPNHGCNPNLPPIMHGALLSQNSHPTAVVAHNKRVPNPFSLLINAIAVGSHGINTTTKSTTFLLVNNGPIMQ